MDAEVDVEYPDDLRKSHNDYPSALEKRGISHDMLLKYCNNIANKYEIKLNGVNKLTSNLGNTGKYVLHYNGKKWKI